MSKSLHRRTIIGSAWAVPALAIVAAVPSTAASVQSVPLSAREASLPQLRARTVTVAVANPTSEPLTITVTLITSAGTRAAGAWDLPWERLTLTVFRITLEAGQSSGETLEAAFLAQPGTEPDLPFTATVQASAPGLTTAEYFLSGTL